MKVTPAKKKRKSQGAAEAVAAGACLNTSTGSSASEQSTVGIIPPVCSADAKLSVGQETPPAEADPMALDNFALSAPVKKQLRSKGIEGLFPIQARSLYYYTVKAAITR